MNVWKKISALTFVLVLALALSVTAFADDLVLSDGKAGSGGLTTTALSGPINIKKEIVVYNPTSTSVAAPTFSYTYTVTAPDVTNMNVTDATTVENQTIVVPVNQGIIPGVKVGKSATGAASGATQATGTLSFTNDMTFTASGTGATNSYNVPIDFTGVTFTQSGVYRYQIDETVTGIDNYAALSMVDGGLNTLYLDVYVNGSNQIYGYVCMTENGSVTSASTKVDGFKDSVTAISGANTLKASDSYYTYDLELSKTVTGDTYAAENNAFPFTVFFEKGATLNATASFKIGEALTQKGNSTLTVGIGTNNAVTVGSSAVSGIAKIQDGGKVTYSGIPYGMEIAVYETNNMTGVTYQVTTATNSSSGSAETVSSTSASNPATAVKQNATKNAYESTAVTFNPTLSNLVSVLQTYAVTNALVNISPTGVTMRYAPYLLTLCAGITVLPLTRSYKRREEE